MTCVLFGKKYKKKDVHAQHALNTFTYRIIKYAGEYTMALGGLDALVFTGGIGVPATYIREKITKAIQKITPKTVILTIPTDEEWEIAQEIIHMLEWQKNKI